MSKYDSSFERIMRLEYENIQKLIKSVDRNVVEKTIDLLLAVKPQSHKVITAGCGTSGILAERVAHSMCVVEIPAFFLSPANAIHGGAGAIQKGDVVVLFSKGGNTKEIINYIPICHAKGATIIGVSQNDGSVLALNSDIYFKIQVDQEADIWNMCASASCNAIAAVWDAVLFTAVQYTDYTKDDLKLIHSGGRVGELLGVNNHEAGEIC